jgi:phosphoglycolate phosphatase-like HAD superfamily hydrolase
MIQDRGLNVRYQDVVDFFQSIFLGANNDGLIMKERWLPKPGHLEALGQKATLAVFTGRMRAEAFLTLDRFAPGVIQDVVGVDDVIHPKPSPEGLIKLSEKYHYRKIWYVGDSVDDALAAREAHVPFVGIAPKNSALHKALSTLMQDRAIFKILENINQMDPAAYA